MLLLPLLFLACSSLLQAQPSPLPLKEGNYWIYDYVLRDQRYSASSRMEVREQVRVPPLEKDRFFGTRAGWNTLFGDTGTAYFKLYLAGGLSLLFPSHEPDTLLVRADESGNILIRGFSSPRSRTMVKAKDQLWLKSRMGAPFYWELDVGTPTAYYWQEEWTGHQDEEGRERSVGFSQYEAEEEVQELHPTFSPQYVALARRFIPDLQAASPNRLLVLGGEIRHSSDATFSVVLLTGIGPLVFPTHTDMTEFQGGRVELSEARIDGRVWKPSPETAVLPQGWAQIKAARK